MGACLFNSFHRHHAALPQGAFFDPHVEIPHISYPMWVFILSHLLAPLLGLYLLPFQNPLPCAFAQGMEVLRAGKESDNVIVGGRNRWEYSSFINWELWWPGFPVLVYFKVSGRSEDLTTGE